jgi:hypothetical protein
MAHPSKEVMSQCKHHLDSFPRDLKIPSHPHICKGCQEGKMKSISFPLSKSRATKPFEKLHSDLKEFPINSYHKNKFSLVIVDDYSSHSWTINIKKKSDTLGEMKHFYTWVEVQYNAKITIWQIDGGGEFTSHQANQFFKEKGIKVQISVPEMHQ